MFCGRDGPASGRFFGVSRPSSRCNASSTGSEKSDPPPLLIAPLVFSFLDVIPRRVLGRSLSKVESNDSNRTRRASDAGGLADNAAVGGSKTNGAKSRRNGHQGSDEDSDER